MGFLLLFFLLGFPCLSHSAVRVPGWLGHKRLHDSVLRMKLGGVPSSAFDPTRVAQLSWRPRAFIYRNFLTDEECDHLIKLAKGKLEKSMVADNESGKSVESEVRTSSGMFLSKAQDEVVADIEARIAAWTFLPIENGESMQILHYVNGQKYEPHFDYFHDKNNQQLGGHRVATVLMYLSNVEKGGETVFPQSEDKLGQAKEGDWSDCAKQGYAGLNRCGKSCRLRWTNYLRPDLNHNSFTPQEEDLILKLHRAIGSRWSLIAKQLPGRTDNDVKNYWNTKLRKKLCKMGIDPLTHKPLSQILSDFGTIAASTAPRPSPSASSTVINPPPPPPPAVHLQIVNDRAQPICGSDPTLAPWNWSDFLTGEAFGGCDLDRVSSIGLQDEKLEVDFGKRGGYGGSDFGNETASSSSCCSSAGSSFVEAILNRDSEIKMELPEFFMEESFYC